MNYRVLGRTGLRVSVLGLGTGTRFGDPRGYDQASATRLVRAALDLGVNYFDTAASYLDAEERLGLALAGVPRESYVVATKFSPVDGEGRTISPAGLRSSVETSLRRLRVDAIDLLQVHGCRLRWLDPVLLTLGEELERLKFEGKVRFLGIGETIVDDPAHELVPVAVRTGRFDQALVGYNVLSPFAESEALPACVAAEVGVVAMVAVRRVLRDPVLLRERLSAAAERGEIPTDELSEDPPLAWLLDEQSPTLAAAGLRFAVSHPAVSCVLAGTLSPEHLREDVAAATAPPLPCEKRVRLRQLFRRAVPGHWLLHDL